MNLKAIATISLGGLMLLASCSDNTDAPEMPTTKASQSDPNLIGYNVTADRQTRALNVYNSTTLPKSFHLSAWAIADTIQNQVQTGSPYIMWDLIQDEGTANAHNWVNEEYPRYWPNNGEPINFFATNAQSGSFEDTKNGRPAYLIPYTTQAAPEQQTDLLYAATYSQRKDPASQVAKSVSLNLHHALSQVVFTATSPNDKLEVGIESVTIAGLLPSGTLRVPNTPGDISWDIPTNAAHTSFTAMTEQQDGAAVLVNADATPLTSANYQTSQAFMLMPQKSNAANPQNLSAGGTYLIVNCYILNNASTEDPANPVDDRLVFGINDDGIIRSSALYIPIAINWQPGKRYVYNLNFGTGAGGYDKNGQQVLFPISYSVTTDNWQEVNGGTI